MLNSNRVSIKWLVIAPGVGSADEVGFCESLIELLLVVKEKQHFAPCAVSSVFLVCRNIQGIWIYVSYDSRPGPHDLTCGVMSWTARGELRESLLRSKAPEKEACGLRVRVGTGNPPTLAPHPTMWFLTYAETFCILVVRQRFWFLAETFWLAQSERLGKLLDHRRTCACVRGLVGVFVCFGFDISAVL